MAKENQIITWKHHLQPQFMPFTMELVRVYMKVTENKTDLNLWDLWRYYKRLRDNDMLYKIHMTAHEYDSIYEDYTMALVLMARKVNKLNVKYAKDECMDLFHELGKVGEIHFLHDGEHFSNTENYAFLLSRKPKNNKPNKTHSI
jgi:hypothetical protein